jgi:hypothetical protein
MKKTAIVVMAAASFLLLASLFSQDFTYVGSAKCGICHKTEKQGQQLPVWEKSKHAASFNALSSENAKPKAQQAGVTNPAEDPKCLKCHAPLAGKGPDLKAEGVTCEACHGPGSEYKKLSIMKDRALAVKSGLIVYDSPEAIKKHCLTCHENAHGQSFDFAASWEKIKHTIPEK